MKADPQTRRTRTLQKLRQLYPDRPARATTAELAQLCGVNADSVRRAYCVSGSYHGLAPIKLPTGRLVWPLS